MGQMAPGIGGWDGSRLTSQRGGGVMMNEASREMSDGSPDRRMSAASGTPGNEERRQFVGSYDKLSPAARELALAIDNYKIANHRRFIDHEEMLQVILSLGYHK
jgi:hypothetical protein